MQQGLRRIGFAEDADRILAQLAEAALNPVTVPLSDREQNYVPTFASRARRRWEDIRALVTEPNEEVPPSEIVRRALAAGIVEGTYPELVREAKHAGAAPPEATAATAPAPTDPFGSQRLEFALSEHRAKVKEALVEAMHALEPYAFERLVLLVLEAVGLEDGVVTARSKDGGVDVRGMLRSVGVVRQPACVQVKRWKANVGRPDVQRLRGALAPNELGIMVTLSDFTKEARSDASSGPTGRSIYCMNGSQLANVMIESQVGVRRYNAVILEIDDLARLTQDSE
jgi:restriction endonuclease Mrr